MALYCRRLRITWRVRSAVLWVVTLAWVLQAPLISTPAAAQWLASATEPSHAFQRVPPAIEKLLEDAAAAYLKGDPQMALAQLQEVMAWVKANLPTVYPRFDIRITPDIHSFPNKEHQHYV